MNKIYIFYLMCMGVSLTFLSTYFSLVFQGYANSVFYIVNMILFSSILLLLFLDNKVKEFANKLLALSFFFLLLYFGLVIIESLFFLTSFGEEVVKVFSIFFLMCSQSLFLTSSISLRNEAMLSRRNTLLLIFSPIIIYSLWILANSSFFTSGGITEQLPLRLFLTAYSAIFSSLISFNLIMVSFNVLAAREKYLIISCGVFLIFFFSGLRQANILVELSSLFSVTGSFVLCLGLIIESSLSLHNKILSSLAESLSSEKRQDYYKYLRKILLKEKSLVYRISGNVALYDNPSLPNIEEKKKYDKIIVLSYAWFKRHKKGSNKMINSLKKYYNQQAYLARRLKSFLI